MNREELEYVVEQVTGAIRHVAQSIMPVAAPSQDASGGIVGSLTEAAMGITAGLVQIAQALQSVAEAIDQHGENTKPK